MQSNYMIFYYPTIYSAFYEALTKIINKYTEGCAFPPFMKIGNSHKLTSVILNVKNIIYIY